MIVTAGDTILVLVMAKLLSSYSSEASIGANDVVRFDGLE